MKKLFSRYLWILFFLPALAHAGFINISNNGTGSVRFSQNLGGNMGQVIFSSGIIITPPGIFVDSQTAFGGFAGASPMTWNLTIGSGANRFLTVACGDQAANAQVTGVTVGGFAMTLSTSLYIDATTRGVQIFTYVNPPSGSQAIVASWGAGSSNFIECNALSFTGVNQSTPIDIATATFHQPGGGPQTVTFTTAVANDMLLDIQTSDADASPIVIAGGQTQQFQMATAGNVTGSSTKLTTTTGSYSMTWTNVDTGTQAAIAIEPAP